MEKDKVVFEPQIGTWLRPAAELSMWDMFSVEFPAPIGIPSAPSML